MAFRPQITIFIIMDLKTKKELVEYLYGFITENKKEKIAEVLSQRTNYIRVIVEDLYQPHNASAVMRSCDCFGVQNLHAIVNNNPFSMSTDITAGSNKWIDLHLHDQEKNNTTSTIKELKEKGYRIVATTPHTNDCNINELDLEKGPLAFFFGTEGDGLTQEMMDQADEFVKIPMYGFTESFNISVSAALILNDVITRLKNSDINWKLTEEETLEIKRRWVKAIIKRGEDIEKEFMEKRTV